MDDAALVAELRGAHDAHTIILYGSRARGDATPESDIDVACFADRANATPLRDARTWNAMFLDGFVYPTAVIAEPATDLELLKFVGARALLDERGLATAFLASVVALEARGPAVLPASEKQMRRVWAAKMLARIRRGDVEANYRYHWLLYQLLEDYFTLRTVWYLGPKLALAELRTRDPVAFAGFERALARDASLDALDALVAIVIAE